MRLQANQIFPRNQLQRFKTYGSGHFNFVHLVLFGAIFAGLGSYIIFHSFAATPGTNLTLTALDSTIRANWTAPADATVKWQVISAWTGDGVAANGSKLVGSKVLGATSNVADMNGLRSGDTYTIKLQSMDATGALSAPTSATAATDPQSPMTNAAYFDNFNDSASGSDLDSNYYDVRAWSSYADTQDIPETRMAMTGERHYHTSVIESEGQGGVLIRPRIPAELTNPDGSPRTITMEFEVDLPPVQAAHGKWFEIHLSKDIPDHHGSFGSTEGNEEFPNNIRFAVDRQTYINGNPPWYNTANIQVNTNGVNRLYGTSQVQFTPGNVRVPIVIKVSPTYAEMTVNGKKVVTTEAKYFSSAGSTNGATANFTLPFTRAHWSLIDANYRSAYDGTNDPTIIQGPTITNQLSHWDMIQWDGPSGSYNPVVKTYMQPNCSGSAAMFYQSMANCPKFITGGGTKDVDVPLTIPAGDDLSKIRSARIMFNAPLPNGMDLKLNGTSLTTFPAQPGANDTIEKLNYYDLTSAQIALLRNGSNTVHFHTTGLIGYVGATQLELEVIYNQPRTIGNPPQEFVPMFSVTAANFRYDKLVGQAESIMIGSTNLYALGADMPHNYTVSQINPKAAPWFTLTSPTSGTLTPIPTGGQMAPISWSIDTSKFTQPSDDLDMGVPAVVKISGGAMPVYVGIVLVKDQSSVAPHYDTFTFNETVFNKASIPDYHASTGGTPIPKTGDLNGDGAINIFDLSILLSNYGRSQSQSSNAKTDLNNDGVINIFDLSILLSNYGK